MSRICAVVITYRRTSALPQVIQSVQDQTHAVADILIVDNGSDPAVESIARESGAVYVDAGENLGPAGAMNIAMGHFVTHYSDDDWLLRLDDDRPLPDDRLLEDLLHLARTTESAGLPLGGVGVTGARWSHRWATLSMVPVDPDVVAEQVDYLATGHFPLFSGRAIHSCGPMSPEFFFGLEEVEYGLRLRRAGFSLLRHGQRATATLGGQDRPPPRPRLKFRIDPPSWRHYYSMRNHIVVAREYSSITTAVGVSVIRGLVIPMATVFASPRNGWALLRLRTRAVIDAWTHQMGRRVDPYDWDRQHGRIDLLDEMPLT